MNDELKSKVDKNNEWFLKNNSKFDKSKGKFVIIQNEKILHYFNCWDEATLYAKEHNLDPGFIIKDLTENQKTNYLGYVGLSI